MPLSINIDLTDRDLEHFNRAIELARKAAGDRSNQEIIDGAVTLLETARKSDPPAFVTERLLLLDDTEGMQRQLWNAAVANAARDMDSDVAALYIESLNDMFAVHTSRLAIGVRTRVPIGIWVVLYSLTSLGMISMGYHAGIAASKRSKATWIVAIAFGMVIVLIASLDRPTGFIRVTQQPLVDVQVFMATERGREAPER